ncbi:MAG: hypothetical protein GX814_02500 [Microbacteriaceae bacterium]|nr:hypothetical protein [Microbacteriaceae bacterium]
MCDVTYVATWSGFAYVSFVTDVYSRRIVGWNVASTLKADVLPLQALEMAAWQLGGDLDGAIHHSDYAEVLVKPRNVVRACGGADVRIFLGLTLWWD